jgi:hypothetical protein
MFVQIKRERDALNGVMTEIRRVLKLDKGESVIDALNVLVNKREDYVMKNLRSEKPVVKNDTERLGLMDQLAKLNLYFSPKDSTSKLKKKLDNFGKSCVKRTAPMDFDF